MGCLAWVIFGALAGWVASLITGTNDRRGCITNIATGIIGAFLGGLLIRVLTGSVVNFGFDLRSFGVAVLGSIVLLVITGAIQRR